MSTNIRAARTDDFDAVTELLELLGRERVTAATRDECRAIFEAQVLDPSTHHMVAADGTGVVGFCSLHFRERLNFGAAQAWIPDLVVADRSRRDGVGRALLEEAERRARGHGCYELVLETGYQRAEAHHLYRQFRMRDQGKFFRKELRAA